MNYSIYTNSIEDTLHNFALEFEYKVIDSFQFNYNINLETKDLEEFIIDMETLNNIIKDNDIDNFIRFGKSLVTLFHNL